MMPSRVDVASSRTIPQVPNGARIFLGTKSALDAIWRITLNAKEVIILPRQTILILPKITRSRTALSITFFFFSR